MEIVIKIDEKDYQSLKDGRIPFNVLDVIMNGTILPKGHGDLIDRGELKTHFIGTEQGTDLEVYLEPTIINAPTIIEADAESEE